jgi:hypothetical protein
MMRSCLHLIRRKFCRKCTEWSLPSSCPLSVMDRWQARPPILYTEAELHMPGFILCNVRVTKRVAFGFVVYVREKSR